jgi:hypothetical protein
MFRRPLPLLDRPETGPRLVFWFRSGSCKNLGNRVLGPDHHSLAEVQSMDVLSDVLSAVRLTRGRSRAHRPRPRRLPPK